MSLTLQLTIIYVISIALTEVFLQTLLSTGPPKEKRPNPAEKLLTGT